MANDNRTRESASTTEFTRRVGWGGLGVGGNLETLVKWHWDYGGRYDTGTFYAWNLRDYRWYSKSVSK